MQMFETFLSSIPKNRSDLVTELELPEVCLSPYLWEPVEDYLLSKHGAWNDCSLSTASSIPLSRAMTDSDIDYCRFRRYQNRCYSNTWDQLKTTLDLFPDGYLDSLDKYYYLSSDYLDYKYPLTSYERRRYDEDYYRRLRRYLDEECVAYRPGDAGLSSLEDAINSVDMKIHKLKMERLYGKKWYLYSYPYYSRYWPSYSSKYYSSYYPWI